MKYLLLFLLSSCQLIKGSEEFTQIGQTYRKDLTFSIDDVNYEGIAIVGEKQSYKFSIMPDKPFDLFTASTCHREITADQVTISKKKRWFNASSKTAIEFEYTPRLGVETEGYCGLELGIYDKDNGQEYWGFVDFVTNMPWTIDAKLYCNGEVVESLNSAVCQARQSLEQRIEFDGEMKAETNCLVLDTYEGKVFTWNQPPIECLTLFFDKEGNHFRLTTFGYDRIKIKDYGFD
mgnify:CR=1 FL=1